MARDQQLRREIVAGPPPRRIGQGRENAKQYLKENPETCDKLEAAIRSRTDAVAEEMMTGPDADSED